MTFTDDNEQDKILRTAVEIVKDRVLNSKSNRINVTKLAKSCKVSRAWVYKNFGSNYKQIVISTIDIIAPLLTASVQPMGVWRTNTLQDWATTIMASFEVTMKQVELYPFLYQFYLAHRLETSFIGQHLAHHEHRFISHIGRQHIELSKSKLDAQLSVILAEHLAAVRVGLIFKWLSYPEISFEKKRLEMQMILKMLLATLK